MEDARSLSRREHFFTTWDRSIVDTGSLQRIADACELMASNYKDLMAERDLYRLRFEEQIRWREAADRRVAALKGVITRMKKRGGE